MIKTSAIILSLLLAFNCNAGLISKTTKTGGAVFVFKAFKKQLQKDSFKIVKDSNKATKIEKSKNTALKPGELNTGSYRELLRNRQTNSGMDAHHMPSDKFMSSQNVSKGDGIAINLDRNRHSLTRTYKSSNKDILAQQETPRQALGKDVRDVKKILEKSNKYSPSARKSLQDVIEKNKNAHPNLYKKDTK